MLGHSSPKEHCFTPLATKLSYSGSRSVRTALRTKTPMRGNFDNAL